MVEVCAPGQFVGRDYELSSLKLRLELHKFVVAYLGPDAFEHALHRGVVGPGERAVDLELLGSQQLHLTILLGGLLQRAVFVLEVEVLGAKYFL